MNGTVKKSLKITAITILSIIVALVLVVGIYVLYVVLQYYRIEDNKVLNIENAKTGELRVGENYTATTYNIGFGAYSHDFDFFLDSGEFKDGRKVSGSGSKAKSKEEALKNTNGAIETVKEQSPDFLLFQEVDLKSDRARGVNQYDLLKSAFDSHSAVYSQNFHSAYLFYPVFDHHGKTDAGIVTLSKYKIESSVRRSLPVDNGFPTRFFDLDRCFSVSTIPVSNSKKLLLINVHMSAYDEGGLIRKEQFAMINEILTEARKAGNYVVMGGDFNHDISNTENTFPTEQKVPQWVFTLTDENLAKGFKFASATNAPTCRSTDMKYTKGINFTAVLDGFVVSDNVTVENVVNIDNDFSFSDHQPAKLTFTLNG